MNFDFNLPAEALFRAMPLCDGTDRYYLDGALIDPDPTGGAWIVATDGKAMLIHFDPEIKVPERCTVKVTGAWLTATRLDYNLDRINNLADVHWCKTRLEFSSENLLPIDSDISIAHCISDAGPDVFCQIRYNPINFPEWRAVLDATSQNTHPSRPSERHTALNTEHLGDLVRWSQGFHVHPAPAGQARLISFVGEPNTFAVIMPMFADESDPLPKLLMRAGRADLIRNLDQAS